ncbi:MAG: sigma-70 family RNA polymerase sigma factor [Syntrophaceae bacterium]|nr:sigma-70 family RNA polymerase sigma factor [Syntrophaceae bacterium]
MHVRMVLTGKVSRLVGEDEDLPFVVRCQRGEVEAFSILVERHQKKMLNVAYRLIGDYDESCDCVQEAFLKAYRAIGQFRREARFATWLYGIVINQTRNRLVQMKKHIHHEGFASRETSRPMGDWGDCALAPQSDSALDRLEQAERDAAVQSCISGLEADFREVLILRDIQELTYEDIQTILEVPPGTVKSRLFRARLALKDCLVKILGDDL